MHATAITALNQGPLYHGTRQGAARQILRSGFRRAAASHYLGTGVCLSEDIAIAYEHGAYEEGGCILQTWLAPGARWTDRSGRAPGANEGEACDAALETNGLDAVRTYGGNVWVVGNPAALVAVQRLSHREALRALCRQFDADGPDCGYNGVASDYASLWWGQEHLDPNLMRFPQDCGVLRTRLLRLVGRCRSELAVPASGGALP